MAVALARRESGADYALDRFEVPTFQIAMANADASRALLGVEEQRELTIDEVRSWVPTLLGHDVLLGRDGYQAGAFIQADLSTDKALNFLARLDQRWTQKTGQVPVEQADTGDVSSGVAVARRQARLVARSRERHTALLRMLSRLLGHPLDWALRERHDDRPPRGRRPTRRTPRRRHPTRAGGGRRCLRPTPGIKAGIKSTMPELTCPLSLLIGDSPIPPEGVDWRVTAHPPVSIGSQRHHPRDLHPRGGHRQRHRHR